MFPRNHEQLSFKEQERLGLPPGFKIYSPFPFGSMNQQASRQGMQDNEFFDRENLIKIGDGKLRSIWDNGDSIYDVTPGKTISNFFFYNIGTTQYAVVFLTDGTAYQVKVDDETVTTISSIPGTFYASGEQLTACGQWGSQYLLLANNLTSNSYWAWDGSVLYGAGSLGPEVTITDAGSGYSAAPTVTAYGGSGLGATFQASVANGSVVSVKVTNPGFAYQPGDVIQLAFSGGGSDDSPILTAVLTSGVIDHVEITNGGSSYSSPTISFTGGGGSGATATATVTSGVITAITLTSGGSGYTGTPTVVITDGAGSGASALSILTPASVASVTIVSGGTHFTGTPTITISGGGGSGATATAFVTDGVITNITIIDAGSGYTSTPTVTASTEFNDAAAATATLMPFGVSGSSIETFQQRVWLPFPNQQGSQVNGGTFLVSAPGSLTDFATSDGGLVYTSRDSLLKSKFVNIKQSNGYLYPFGDSSVNVISNVQTSGVPSTTTFNYQNTDPQIGVAWRDSCQAFSRTILFANKLGVYGLYGGAVTKISSKIDDIFINALFPPDDGALTPSSAVANIFNLKTYLMLMTVTDPLTETARNVMISWDERDWFITSQTSDLAYIGTQEVESDLKAWGTDGSSLFPLFSQASSTLSKKLSTKLYGANNPVIIKQALGFYLQAQDRSGTGAGVTLDTATADTEVGSFAMPNTVSFLSAPPAYNFYGTTPGDVYGVNIGATITSKSPDFIVTWLGIGYFDMSSVFGNTPLAGTNIE